MKYYLRLALFTYFLPFCCMAEDDRTLQLLRKLTDVPGASGFEGPVRDILREEWNPLLENLHADGMGNLVGILPSKAEKSKTQPRVLIMAHMDEVGFLVREITEEGFIYMQAVGDWIDPVLLAQRWVISTAKGPIKGYSGVESIHATSEDMKLKAPPQKKIFLDIGAGSREEVLKMGIRPGLPITPEAVFTILPGGKRYMAKAFDDRALLAVMTEALEQLKDKDLDVQVIAAATVQEEPGMRGSMVVYEQTKPDIVINLDVGIARDFPLYFSEGKGQPVLGKGPSVFVFDWSMIPNDKLVNYIVETADKIKVPLQYELEGNYGEDGCNLQKSGKGVACVNLGLPVRYPHSHSGVMDRSDYEQMVKLLVELVQNLSPQTIENIKNF